MNSIARCIDPDVASVNQVWPCLLRAVPPSKKRPPSPSRSAPSASDNDSEDDEFMVGKAEDCQEPQEGICNDFVIILYCRFLRNFFCVNA